MKTLLISCSDVNTDGRLRELQTAFALLGEVVLFTPWNDNQRLSAGKKNYVQFISHIVRHVKRHDVYDLIVADNRLGIIPAYLAAKHSKRRVLLVNDARELYLLKDVKSAKAKLGCLIEKIFLPKADVIIAANAFRARYMEKYYKLTNTVLTFENLRQLTWSSYDHHYFDNSALAKKLDTNRVNLLSTSGCLLSRGNDRLVRVMADFADSAHLFLVGKSPQSDEQHIKSILETEKIKNVSIIDQVDEGTLKYILSKCDIGIVNYHRNDINNEYCASGKLYEFLFEGMPVVTTENPTLKELVVAHSLGASDDSYALGIKQVMENLSDYREHVKAYVANVSISSNNRQLADEIMKRYKDKTS